RVRDFYERRCADVGPGRRRPGVSPRSPAARPGRPAVPAPRGALGGPPAKRSPRRLGGARRTAGGQAVRGAWGAPPAGTSPLPAGTAGPKAPFVGAWASGGGGTGGVRPSGHARRFV